MQDTRSEVYQLRTARHVAPRSPERPLPGEQELLQPPETHRWPARMGLPRGVTWLPMQARVVEDRFFHSVLSCKEPGYLCQVRPGPRVQWLGGQVTPRPWLYPVYHLPAMQNWGQEQIARPHGAAAVTGESCEHSTPKARKYI